MDELDETAEIRRDDLDLGGDAGTRTGRYTILGQIGVGGFGRVLRAHDEELDRDVAIKVLTRLDDDVVAMQRFLREGQLTSQIRHSNIVEVYDHGIDQGWRPFVVYQLISGADLARRTAEGYSQEELLRWASEICDALQAVHEAGAVHRDVKPENVLIDEGGRALLADFGLARRTEGSATLTRTGSVVGTPAFLAPELWHGDEASPASDQWSWAASLFQVLYDQSPFGFEKCPGKIPVARLGQPVEIPREHRGRYPGLERILRRALRQSVGDRFEDMAAFGAALRKLASEEAPPPPERVSWDGPMAATLEIARPEPSRSRRPYLALPLVGLVLLLLFWGGAGTTEVPPSETRTAPDSSKVIAAVGRLFPGHRVGDGSPQGYEDHLAQIRETFAEPRFALRYRRVLNTLAEWAREAESGGRAPLEAADRMLREEVLPITEHMARDWGMARELENSQGFAGQLGDAGRNASSEELLLLKARFEELGEMTLELVPKLGILVSGDRAASLSLRAGLLGLYNVGNQGDMLAQVLRLLPRLSDDTERLRLLMHASYLDAGIFGMQPGDCAQRAELVEAITAQLRRPVPEGASLLAVSLGGRATSQFYPYLSRCGPDPGYDVLELFETLADLLEVQAPRAPAAAEMYLRWYVLTDGVILGNLTPTDPVRWAALGRRLRAVRRSLPGKR